MHAFLEWLRTGGLWLQKHWPQPVMYFVIWLVASRSARRTRRTAREDVAKGWPSIEGVAKCWTRPRGWGRCDLFVRGVISDGQSAVCTRTLLAEEARYYARSLEGQTVAVHVNRRNRTEWILCWEELQALVPEFVSPIDGRLTQGGFRAVQAFRGVAVGGFALAVADASAFATPWGRNFMWHDMCLCELSMLLLAFGIVLLLGARGLRARMGMLPGPERELAPVWQSGTRWLAAVAGGIWFGVIGFALIQSNMSDFAVYVVLTAPVFPLFWWSMGVGMMAVEQLRPPETNQTVQTAMPVRCAEAEAASGVVGAHG